MARDRGVKQTETSLHSLLHIFLLKPFKCMSDLKKMFLSIVNKQMSHEDLGMFNLVKKKKRQDSFCKNGVGRQKLVILCDRAADRGKLQPKE